MLPVIRRFSNFSMDAYGAMVSNDVSRLLFQHVFSQQVQIFYFFLY